MSLLSRLNEFGILEGDSEDVRLQKNMLVHSSLMMAVVAVLWGLVYIHFDEPLAGAIPLGYAVASFISLFLFGKLRRYHLFRTSQSLFGAVLPFLLAITLGGFIPSSGVIICSIVSPLTTLLYAGRRQALLWMIAVVLVIVAAALLESVGWVGSSNLPGWLVRTFFVMNISVVGAVAFQMLYIFVGQKDQAMELVARERQKSDELLANILPDPIARRLKSQDRPIADGLDDVTILFADIVGFTRFATRRSPEKVVSLLDEVFSELDELASRYGVEKIKTVGDAYMVAGGMPVTDPGHARGVADFALGLLQCLVRLRQEKGHDVAMRIGIHSGPVVAGVIGKSKYSYDVWGDTVNVAAKLEQAGRAGHILISAGTREHLGDDYLCERREPIVIAGREPVAVFELLQRKDG